MSTQTNILRIDASGRVDGSTSRQLTDQLIGRLTASQDATVTTRDLLDGVPFVDPSWIDANFTAPEERTNAQKEALAVSDGFVEELEAADTVVIGMPIYNFGPPAALKAWVDMIARARRTFRYTENGPEGLLTGKRAYVIVSSGGTEVGSTIDFASGYIRHALSFVGITDVTVIDAGRGAVDHGAATINALPLERVEAQAA